MERRILLCTKNKSLGEVGRAILSHLGWAVTCAHNLELHERVNDTGWSGKSRGSFRVSDHDELHGMVALPASPLRPSSCSKVLLPKQRALLNARNLALSARYSGVNGAADISGTAGIAGTTTAAQQGFAGLDGNDNGASVIIGADKLVAIGRRSYFFDGSHSYDEAYALLSKLSGRRHRVYTALCLLYGGRGSLGASQAVIKVKRMTEREIASVAAVGLPTLYRSPFVDWVMSEDICIDFPARLAYRLLQGAGIAADVNFSLTNDDNTVAE